MSHWNKQVSTLMIILLSALPAHAEEARLVRQMIGSRIVYQGPEKTDLGRWKIERVPFTQLRVTGPLGSTKSIAILAYPYDLDIAPSGWGFDRAKYAASELKKKGLIINDIKREPTLAEQYKYLLRYDVDRKRVEVNFFNDNSAVYMNVIEFSEEKVSAVDSLWGNGAFPQDLSMQVAQKTVRVFEKDGYRALDLTGSRDELAGKSLEDILVKVHDLYGINRVLFLPFKAYTKWVLNMGSSKEADIGLLLCYAAVLYEQGNPEPVFVFTENLDLGEESFSFLGGKQKSIIGQKINFYSEDWSEDRKIHPNRPIKFYKDGVFDDAWAAGVVMEKFSGLKFLSAELKPTQAGGHLFEKLQSLGILANVYMPEFTDEPSPAPNAKRKNSSSAVDERSIESYYEELGIKH